MAGELQAHRAHLAAAQNLRYDRITVFLFMSHNFKVKSINLCLYQCLESPCLSSMYLFMS